MIVVTGGAGFIGSALVWELNRRGIVDILVVDELGTDEKWKNLVNLEFKDYIHKDEFLKRVEQGDFEGALDGILHMGACSSTTEIDADYLARNNYEYSKRLATWALKDSIRFVYASSAATYGDGSKGFSDVHELIPQLKPLNMYAYSKQMFDVWLLKGGLLDRVAGLKYFNVFGPNEYRKQEMRSVVHKAFCQIMDSGKVRLFKSHNPEYKDGWQLRDFLYVKDAVDMTLFVYDHTNINGIYNVGSGKARSFYDLVVAVFRAMEREPVIEYFDMPSAIRGKYQYFTQAEMQKLREAGYECEITSLEQGISDYVKNYLMPDNPYLGNDEKR